MYLHKCTSLTWIWIHYAEIQFNVKLFGDKQCRCKEGWLYLKRNQNDQPPLILTYRLFQHVWNREIMEDSFRWKWVNYYLITWHKRQFEQHSFTTVSRKVKLFNSFPASDDFCRLLITFANSLDPDQDLQNVGPDLNPTCLTFLILFLKENLEIKFIEKSTDDSKNMKNTQHAKGLT